MWSLTCAYISVICSHNGNLHPFFFISSSFGPLGEFYKTDIRLAMFYIAKCWATKKQHIHKMSVTEMRMLQWISGKIRKDKIRNQFIHGNLGVALIGDKRGEIRLRWFGHMEQRPMTAPMRTEIVAC